MSRGTLLRSWTSGWLRVDTERVRLPNGREADLDVVRHPGAACILPFVTEDEVLLLRQYRHATGGTILEAPAGKLDPGEPPEVCAARELVEETGYRAGRIEHLSTVWTTPGFTDEVMHLYAAWDLTHEGQQLEPDEVIELVPTPLTDALARVHAGEITDAKTALTLLLAAKRLGAP